MICLPLYSVNKYLTPMKILKTFGIYLIFAFPILFFLSCSSSKNEIENVYSDFYFNPKYENSKFSDATLGIIVVNLGFDTLSSKDLEVANPKMIDFGKTFIEYFPIGIKNFSTFKKADWIYYNSDTMSECIEYKFNSSLINEINISLPYSMNYFKSKTTADFIMFVKYFSIQTDPEELSQTNSMGKRYKRKFEMKYYVWENNNLELITIDKIETTSEFEKIPKTVSFRNIILKMAYEIFQKLPMFKK
jgi:hypothetical protein